MGKVEDRQKRKHNLIKRKQKAIGGNDGWEDDGTAPFLKEIIVLLSAAVKG